MNNARVVAPEASRVLPTSTFTPQRRYATMSWQSSPAFSSTLNRAIQHQTALEQAMRTRAAPRSVTTRPLASMQRVDQNNAAEYDNAAHARMWSGSSCSAASLAAVLRSKGVNVKIADVMRAMPGALTPELGLVSRPGLVQAAERLGLRAADDVRTFDDLRRTVGSGAPVLVDIRNAKFPDGHWLVVKGVTPTNVEVVDSSGLRLTSIPTSQFLKDWSGKGIRIGG